VTLFRPGLEGFAKLHELSEVIGIVVRGEQGFPHEGLTLTAGNGLEERTRAVENEPTHLVEEVSDGVDALIPGFVTRRSR